MFFHYKSRRQTSFHLVSVCQTIVLWSISSTAVLPPRASAAAQGSPEAPERAEHRPQRCWPRCSAGYGHFRAPTLRRAGGSCPSGPAGLAAPGAAEREPRAAAAPHLAQRPSIARTPARSAPRSAGTGRSRRTPASIPRPRPPRPAAGPSWQSYWRSCWCGHPPHSAHPRPPSPFSNLAVMAASPALRCSAANQSGRPAQPRSTANQNSIFAWPRPTRRAITNQRGRPSQHLELVLVGKYSLHCERDGGDFLLLIISGIKILSVSREPGRHKNEIIMHWYLIEKAFYEFCSRRWQEGGSELEITMINNNRTTLLSVISAQ